MTTESPRAALPVFTATDDAFHEVGDRWWATETAWFSFSVPERRLGGWLYTLARPNIGIVQGGAWVWDDSAWAPWEVLYSRNHSATALDPGTDLRHARLRTGVEIDVIEPAMAYRIGYSDPGRLEADLRVQGVHPPVAYAAGRPPFLSASHFDQTCRVTGSVVLHGERIAVDCLSVRDRSWGPRPETRPRRLAYCFGTVSEADAFFVTTSPASDGSADHVDHGYLIRDGVTRRLVAGDRRVERDPGSGWVRAETISGADEAGNTFRATGVPVSHTAVNRHTAVTWTYLMKWRLDGRPAWGEDQDMWPVADWAAFRRSARMTDDLGPERYSKEFRCPK
jgi:hypothetical protein